MDGPLADITVVELSSGLVVPAAGAILGDLGAEVIKIEPPGGHPERRDRGRAGPDAPEHCLPFALHNRGKRSVILDLDEDVPRLKLLLAASDILLTDLGAQRLTALELDRHPTLIHASVTAFGRLGPDGDVMSSDEAAFFSRAGTTALMGAGRPFTFGHGQGARSSAFALSAGALAALLRRDQNGDGQRVETSLLAAGIYSIANDFTVALGTGEQPPLRDRKHPLNALGNSYRCGDGKWLMIGVASAAGQPAWERFRRMLGSPAWMSEERFATTESRRDHTAEMVVLLEEVFTTASCDEWGRRLRGAGLNWTPIPEPADAVTDPQLEAAGVFTSIPESGNVTIATPLAIRDVPLAPRRGVPEPGEDTKQVLALLDGDRVRAKTRGVARSRPLEGLRVLDLSTYVAAPAVGALLSDLGAQVLKVEPPTGDARRGALTQLAPEDPDGLNRTFEMDNRNKQSIAIALDHPEGPPLVLRLAQECDVFLTNLLPPRQSRFGLTADAVLAANPNVIYASLTAYGTEGPDADMGGFDIQAFFARTGITGMLSRQAGSPPRPRSGQGDHITALVIMTGILAALRQRERTGAGQVVETSLVAVGAYTIGSDILLARAGLEASDSVHPLSACYRCADDRWLQLAVSEGEREALWPAFCALADIAEETAGVDQLEQIFATDERDQWGARLAMAGIPWVRVQTLPEVIEDPHLEVNGMVGELVHEEHGSIRFVNPPYRIDGMAVPVPARGPHIGEHTFDVLSELGLDASEIEQMNARGVFGSQESGEP